MTQKTEAPTFCGERMIEHHFGPKRGWETRDRSLAVFKLDKGTCMYTGTEYVTLEVEMYGVEYEGHGLHIYDILAKTPQAAANKVEKRLLRTFKSLGKVLGYEVTG